MSLLFDTLFTSVAFSHFIVDVLNGHRSVLFAYLSGPLGLTNANLGVLSTLSTLIGGLMQPLFGYLSDRAGPRWVVAGGVLWMGAAYALGMIIPGRLALIFLVIASVGSGAFHPAGTMQATARGRTHMSGQETTATSYFFLFGQGGLFTGPFVAGLLLDGYGKRGLLILPLLAVIVGLIASRQLRYVRSTRQEKAPVENPTETLGRISLVLILILAIVAASRSWAQQSAVTFLPKYLSDLGMSASRYGSLSGLFMGGSAVGLMTGGKLADRFDKRLIVATSIGLASLPFFLLPFAGESRWLYLLIPLAGAFTGASHSVLVVFAQRVLPGRMGLASGLILGFMFSSGSLGALISGFLADQFGIALVFPLAAIIALMGAMFSLRLPST